MILVLGKSALSVPDTRFSRVSGSTLVMMLSRNESTDVCKGIDVLIDYMIEKNIVMSVKFLQYLDVV